MYVYMCIYQSNIQDPYYCLQDPTISDVHDYSHLTSYRDSFCLPCKSHMICLVTCQPHHTCSVSGSCLCCLCREHSFPRHSLSLINNYHLGKMTTLSKHGMSWNFLSLYLLYFSSWHFSLPGIILYIYLIISPWEQGFACFIHRWIPESEAVTGIDCQSLLQINIFWMNESRDKKEQNVRAV